MGKLRFRKPKTDEYLGIPPIGIILAFSKDVRPAQIYGGDWERCGQGKVIVGVNENDSDFIAPTVIEDNGNITSVTEKIGGEKAHTLIVGEMPSHSHSTYMSDGTETNEPLKDRIPHFDWNKHGQVWLDTGGKGGDQPHNNLQPYMTAYFWRRIA